MYFKGDISFNQLEKAPRYGPREVDPYTAHGVIPWELREMNYTLGV